MDRLESLTALAFDPRRAKPAPKRGGVLAKQGFTNMKNTQQMLAEKRTTSMQSQRLKANAEKERRAKLSNDIFAEMNLNRSCNPVLEDRKG